MMLGLLLAVAAVTAFLLRERSHRRQIDTLRSELLAERANHSQGDAVSVGQMVSGLAQELKGPLQQVLGSTELMMATVDAGAAPNEELRQIHDGAQRAAGIVRDLAAFADTSALTCRWQDVNDIVGRAIDACRLERRSGAVSVERGPSVRVPLVYVDGRRLEKIVAGFILRGPRAVEALRTQPAPPSRSIAVLVNVRRTATPRDAVAIAIEDNGPVPVNEEQTLAAADLAAARHVVMAHGGSLTIGPRLEGTGVQTLIELPVSAAAGASQEQGQPWTELSTSSTSIATGISTS